MKKRIFAWILLIGFILLLLNILVFRVYMELFLVVYIIIVFAFIFSKGKLFQQDEPSEQVGPEVQGGLKNTDENSNGSNGTNGTSNGSNGTDGSDGTNGTNGTSNGTDGTSDGTDGTSDGNNNNE